MAGGDLRPPVAGARVRAGELGATSGADGAYALETLAPGRYELVATSAGEGAASAVRAVVVARGEQHEGIDLELSQGGAIAGVVVDERGAPVEAAGVAWVGERDGCDAETDSDGAFRCDGLAGGSYRARVTLNRQRVDEPHAPVVLADGAARVDDVRLVARVGRQAIAGRVVDAAGAPVADARVGAMVDERDVGAAALTGVDGEFRLGSLVDGQYTLVARTGDGATGTTPNVSAGASGVRITLARPGTIRGTLVGFRGEPRIEARRVNTIDRPVRAERPDASSFRIAPLPAGDYVVSAQGRDEADAARVVVTAGAESTVTLRARGSGAIDGTFRELPGGAPVNGIRCYLSVTSDGAVGPTAMRDTVDGDAPGHFVFDPAPAGPAHVHCYSRGDWSLSGGRAQVVVPAGGRVAVEVNAVRRRGDRSPDNGLRLDRSAVPPTVDAVAPGSPAAAAGLRPGDVIVAVDGIPMSTIYMNGVHYLLWSHDRGDRVPIVVERGGVRVALAIIVE